MIKILINENEIIEFNGHMDLRIGQELKVLGNKYYIKEVKSTKECVKVELMSEYEWENRFKLQIDSTTMTHGLIGRIGSGTINTGRNPFNR